MSVELVRFLMQRLDEDEAAALAALRAQVSAPRRHRFGRPAPGTTASTDLASRWDTPRILVECEVKRRIMLGEAGCDTSRVLRLLALPYASHRDYQESWKPQPSPHPGAHVRR